MSKGTPSSDSAEKTKTIRWNWNKDAFINDQQTQYPGIRVESMFEGVGRLVYEVESLIDAVIRWYAYSAHRRSDNRPIIEEKELDSHEYINELDGSLFVKIMWEISGKSGISSKDDVDVLKNVLKERDYFLHHFFHEYHKKRLEPGWMDDRINQLKAALVMAYGLTSKYEEAVEGLVTGINKPRKAKKPAEEKAAEPEETEAEETEPAETDEESEDDSDVEEELESYERPVRDYGYQRRDDRGSYGDRPRNNYNRDGGRPRNNNYRRDGDRPRGDRKPYGDRPRNNSYNGDRRSYGDRPRNSYHSDGDRPRNNYNRDGDRPHRDGDYRSKPRYDGGDRKPYGDRPRNNYNREGDRPRGDRKPYGDRPRNNSYNGDRRPYGDRPRNNYHHDGDRKPYGDKPHYGDREGGRGDYKKRPYKPRDGDRKDY